MFRQSRNFWILFVLVAIIVGGGFAYAKFRRPSTPAYDFVTATRRDVVREVSVTGRVKAVSEVALAFDVTGRIARVVADVGAHIAAGVELVVLDSAALRAEQQQRLAALAQARAELAELRAGTRPEEVRVTEADVENARRALADAEVSLREIEAKAAVDLEGRYRAAPNTLRDAYAKADDAVRKQTDDIFSNDATDNPQLTFQTSNFQAEIDAERGRSAMETLLIAWARVLDTLPEDAAGRDAALADASSRLREVSAFLDQLLAAVNGAANITAATVATYKTNVTTGRTNVNTARTSVEDLRQAMAAQRATNDTAIATSRAAVTTARNTLGQAEAKLALARAGATSEQIAAAEARVAAADANVTAIGAELAKAVLRAPLAGTVTAQDARVGAAVTMGATLMRVMSDAGLVVEANVPEVDLQGLAAGNPATATLDAYGNDVIFRTTVTAIDPAATIIEGVPTYRTTLAFIARDDRIRAGMTANVTITAGEQSDVVAIPIRAVVARDGETVARVLRNGAAVEIPIRLGLRGSDGYVEVIEGLDEGAAVIRSERERK